MCAFRCGEWEGVGGLVEGCEVDDEGPASAMAPGRDKRLRARRPELNRK